MKHTYRRAYPRCMYSLTNSNRSFPTLVVFQNVKGPHSLSHQGYGNFLTPKVTPGQDCCLVLPIFDLVGLSLLSCEMLLHLLKKIFDIHFEQGPSFKSK